MCMNCLRISLIPLIPGTKFLTDFLHLFQFMNSGRKNCVFAAPGL